METSWVVFGLIDKSPHKGRPRTDQPLAVMASMAIEVRMVEH